MLSGTVPAEEVFSRVHATIIAVQDHAEAGGGRCPVDRAIHVAISGEYLSLPSVRAFLIDPLRRWTTPLRCIEYKSGYLRQWSTLARLGRRRPSGSRRRLRCAPSSISVCALVDLWICFQNFITFVDALKLRMRAKDQLHPILQELVTSYARFKGSKDWEGRSKMVGW